MVAIKHFKKFLIQAINHTTSKEINLSATTPVEKKYKNREGGWEKNYQRYTTN